jgi:uncharacterized protein YkwD
MMRVFEVRRHGAAILLLAALGLPLVAADTAEKPAAPAVEKTAEPAAKPSPGVSLLIVEQTNSTRARFGLPPLRINTQLSLAAKQHADYMARTGQFSHHAGGTSPTVRAVSQGYRSYSVMENIAYNYGGRSSTSWQLASKLMGQWLTSSGHRAAILSRGVNEIGVATARTPDGRIYGVQVFGRGPARIRPASLTQQQ